MKSESTYLTANEMFRVCHLKQQKPSGCFQGVSKKTSDISWVNAFKEKIKDTRATPWNKSLVVKMLDY